MEVRFDVILPLMAIAYVSGTWLGALSVCRWAGVDDPCLKGSGNPGFSNVLRLYGRRLALATLAVDVVKGMPVLWLAMALGLPPWVQGVVGLGVLLGHSYPVWHHFQGGKGVASAFGVMLMLTPGVALVCAAIWVLLAWRVNTAAIASLGSATAAPLASVWLAPEYVGVVIAFTSLVLLRHVLNIRRLGRGEEPHL